jgi:Tfp pilus assembly protein PilF
MTPRVQEVALNRVVLWYLTLAVYCLTTPLVLVVDPVFAQPSEADVLVAQGVLAYEAKRYDEAVDLLTRARTFDPQNARGLYYLGLTELALQHPEKAIDPLESARQLQPNDPNVQYQLGVAYFAAGRYEEASPLFEALYAQQPNMENLGYYVGLTRYRKKDYKPAVEAFDRGNVSDPNLQRLAAFYRGLALGVTGMTQEASAAFQDLQRSRAVDPLTQTAIRLSESLAARQAVQREEKRFRASISLGGYYDDNVAINPDNCSKCDPAVQSLVDLFRQRRTNSFGNIATVNGEYAFIRMTGFETSLSYSFLQTLNYAGDLDRFNIQSHQPGLHSFYRTTLADMPFQLGFDYTYDYVFLDMNGFLSRHSPTLSATIVEPNTTVPLFGSVGHMTTTLGRYQKKNFFGEFDPRFPSEQRDGYNTMIGLFHSFRFANDRTVLRIGYEYDIERTEGTAFSYNGHRLEAGLQFRLPWDLYAGYTFSSHFRTYQNAQTLFLDKDASLSARYDTQFDHLVQITKALSEHWLVTAQYSHTNAVSNIPIYDYTKNVVTGLVSWVY